MPALRVILPSDHEGRRVYPDLPRDRRGPFVRRPDDLGQRMSLGYVCTLCKNFRILPANKPGRQGTRAIVRLAET